MKPKLHKEWRDFLELLLSEKVEFVVIGGICVSYYARPRFTGDIDLFINNTSINAEKAMKAVEKFGFGGIGISVHDFQKDFYVIQLGREPRRIDILTGLGSIAFDAAWNSRVYADFGGLSVPFLSKELLIKNKIEAGRAKDKDDIENLQKIR
jgi:predicted nucleotidyltransferase